MPINSIAAEALVNQAVQGKIKAFELPANEQLIKASRKGGNCRMLKLWIMRCFGEFDEDGVYHQKMRIPTLIVKYLKLS